jgi:hypothetical protein
VNRWTQHLFDRMCSAYSTAVRQLLESEVLPTIKTPSGGGHEQCLRRRKELAAAKEAWCKAWSAKLHQVRKNRVLQFLAERALSGSFPLCEGNAHMSPQRLLAELRGTYRDDHDHHRYLRWTFEDDPTSLPADVTDQQIFDALTWFGVSKHYSLEGIAAVRAGEVCAPPAPVEPKPVEDTEQKPQPESDDFEIGSSHRCPPQLLDRTYRPDGYSPPLDSTNRPFWFQQ